MKLILIIFSILAVLLIIPTSTTIASFASPNATLPEKGAIPDNSGVYQGGSDGPSFINTVSLIINWLLGFIGIIVFVIFLYAGFEYATAGGDETKTKNAQARMANAIIGLLILFFAFVASNAVLSFVFQVNNTNSGNTNSDKKNAPKNDKKEDKKEDEKEDEITLNFRIYKESTNSNNQPN
jgi:amino acid transporter